MSELQSLRAALPHLPRTHHTHCTHARRRSVSALPALARLAAAGAPVTIVGAGRNGDCVPRAANYAAFWRACGGGGDNSGDGSSSGSGTEATSSSGSSGGGGARLLAVAREAGHLQAAQGLPTLLQAACFASPRLDEAALRAWCGALLAARALALGGGGGGGVAGGDSGGGSEAEAAAALGEALGLSVMTTAGAGGSAGAAG